MIFSTTHFGVSTNFIPWAPRITARGSRSARSMGFREAEVTFPPTYKYIPGGSWMAIPSGGGTCVVRCFTGAPNWSLCFFWGGLYSYFIYVYIYMIYIIYNMIYIYEIKGMFFFPRQQVLKLGKFIQLPSSPQVVISVYSEHLPGATGSFSATS